MAGKVDTSIVLMRKLRPRISPTNPLICDYYCLQEEFYQSDPVKKNLYADSALLFFQDGSRVKKYPSEYFHAVLVKGDACLRVKKYLLALNYFYECQKMISAGNCDHGDLASRMGIIYFSQKKFLLAARCWAESYSQLEICHSKFNRARLFVMEQGALNNTGVAYERAGLLDSANYYYLKDLQLINEIDSSDILNKSYSSAPRAVVYDNLGGVNLKWGNLDKAEDYLLKCLAVPSRNTDGLRIPPLIKLAELYLKKGEDAKAEDAFKESKTLLHLFREQNPDSELRWNKLYAAYLFKHNRSVEAYNCLDVYTQLKDSLYNSYSELYQLDIDRELNAIRQDQTVTELSHNDRVKKIYLIGFTVIIVLWLVILIMIKRDLAKTKRNHKDTTIHNQQLQSTLTELERVNKNNTRILRIMAHDLRNPLAGMTGLTTLILGENEPFSEQSRHMLKLIETTGNNSIEMINELLKSGLSDENEKIEMQELDLKSLLYDTVELLQFKASEKQQQIVFVSDDTPVMVKVSHEKIWRVFNNLIVNAIKFSHIGGIIKVSIRVDQKYILIAVADSGIGIADKDREVIFDMFTSAKRVGTNGEQPFGLGLSISKKIIEKHNGEIWFESEPGVGTTFYIRLPRS